MNRTSRANQIMYDFRLKQEWQKRLERQKQNARKFNKNEKEVKNGKNEN